MSGDIIEWSSDVKEAKVLEGHKFDYCTSTEIQYPDYPSISIFSFLLNDGRVLTSALAACEFRRVGTLIVATIYLQLIQNRYMFRSFTVLHCSHQHCVQPVASDVKVIG